MTFTRVLALQDIRTEKQHYELAASADDRAIIADRLDLLALDHFTAEVSIFFARKAFVVTGHFKALLDQKCVVTLDAVPAVVEEKFELELVSVEEADRRDAEELYADPETPDYDAYEGGEIDLGEIVIQSLAVALEPYPRKDDIDIQSLAREGLEIDGEPLKKKSPFAALEALKNKS